MLPTKRKDFLEVDGMKRLFVVLLFLCFACVVRASDMQVLDMGSSPLSFSTLVERVGNQTGVQKVRAVNTTLTAKEAAQFYNLYPHVELEVRVRFAGHTLAPGDTAFAMANSRTSKRYCSEDFIFLRYFKSLRVLDLAHNSISDLDFLLPLTEMRILLLGDNNIVNLSPLSSLPKLEYLELFKNKIINVEPISELESLLDLNICFNYIADYTPLYNMSNLERLWMYNSNKYSTKNATDMTVVQKLTRVLPRCLIDGTSYSTLGGWREHYRWYVIRNMTRRALTWLPWESDGFTQELTRIPQSEIERLARLWSTQRKIDQ